MYRQAVTVSFALIAGLALGACSTETRGQAQPAPRPSTAPSSAPATDGAGASWDKIRPCKVLDENQQRQLGISSGSSTSEDFPDSGYQSQWQTRDCTYKKGDSASWDIGLDVRNYRQHPYQHAPLPGGYTDSAEKPITVDGHAGAEFNQGDLGNCHIYVQLTDQHSLSVGYGFGTTDPGDAQSQDPAARKQMCDQAMALTQLAVPNILQGGG